MIKKEDKFFVLKMQDLTDFLEAHPEYRKPFDEIWVGIGVMREAKGKKRFNNYVCCNLDEPYAEKVWQMILEGEEAKLK